MRIPAFCALIPRTVLLPVSVCSKTSMELKAIPAKALSPKEDPPLRDAENESVSTPAPPERLTTASIWAAELKTRRSAPAPASKVAAVLPQPVVAVIVSLPVPPIRV